MRFNRFLWCAALAVWVLHLSSTASPQEMTQKKRVALLNFEDYSSGGTEAAKVFGVDARAAAKGISVQLIEKLTAGGKYTLVDQSAVKRLLQEQNSSDDDRLDAYARAAKIGRMLGLDAMIVGAITRFGPDAPQKDKASGPSGISTWKSKAYVDITARVLDMTTAEVIAEFTATGESNRTGEVMRVKPRGHATDAQDILGNEFVDSLIGEATRNAVEQIAAQLNSFAAKIPILNIEVDGRVAEVNGNSMTLNLGKKSGVRVGDKLLVLREIRTVNDPLSGESLSTIVEHVGDATVTDVVELSATAIFSGSGQALAGDHVKGTISSRAPPPH